MATILKYSTQLRVFIDIWFLTKYIDPKFRKKLFEVITNNRPSNNIADTQMNMTELVQCVLNSLDANKLINNVNQLLHK